MSRGKSWIKLVVLTVTLVAIAGAIAYIPLIHVVHIRINPSENKTEVWEENTSESPITVIITPRYKCEIIAKKLFGHENPTLLDAVRKVLEMPKGREKVQELINSYGAIYFFGIFYNLVESSIAVHACPLAKPQECITFMFPYNESIDSFSFGVAGSTEDIETSLDWRYRNVTDEELKVLLSVRNISHYNNTVFLAGESDDPALANILPLIGFAWESKAINLSGFKAHRGVQVSITYEGGKELDERVDEIIVIKR